MAAGWRHAPFDGLPGPGLIVLIPPFLRRVAIVVVVMRVVEFAKFVRGSYIRFGFRVGHVPTNQENLSWLASQWFKDGVKVKRARRGHALQLP